MTKLSYDASLSSQGTVGHRVAGGRSRGVRAKSTRGRGRQVTAVPGAQCRPGDRRRACRHQPERSVGSSDSTGGSTSCITSGQSVSEGSSDSDSELSLGGEIHDPAGGEGGEAVTASLGGAQCNYATEPPGEGVHPGRTTGLASRLRSVGAERPVRAVRQMNVRKSTRKKARQG